MLKISILNNMEHKEYNIELNKYKKYVATIMASSLYLAKIEATLKERGTFKENDIEYLYRESLAPCTIELTLPFYKTYLKNKRLIINHPRGMEDIRLYYLFTRSAITSYKDEVSECIKKGKPYIIEELDKGYYMEDSGKYITGQKIHFNFIKDLLFTKITSLENDSLAIERESIDDMVIEYFPEESPILSYLPSFICRIKEIYNEINVDNPDQG